MALQRLIGNAATSRMVTAQRSAVHDVLSTPGAPPAPPARQDVEGSLGADFSDVRLHTDTAAQRSAVGLGAHACSSGSHIVSGPGGLDRETPVHELAYVVRQRQGPVAGTDAGGGLRVGDPGDRYEREAEEVAEQVVSGDAPALGHTEGAPSGAVTGHVQRKVGFEAEIDLPVTKGNGRMFEVGDTKLGDSTMSLVEGGQDRAFDVVTDKRSLNRAGPYSNTEFVTGAVSVVGPEHETGAARLHRIADEMRVVQEQFYLGSIRARLPEIVQDFLDTFDVNEGDNVFSDLFDEMQKQTFSGEEGEGYNPEDSSQIDEASRVVSFENYAYSAFKRAGSGPEGGGVTQEEVFGGMNTIAPHDEHGSVMVPMEIRRLGGRRKTWEQLKTDLANLVDRAEDAYRRDQELTQGESDQEGKPLPSRPRT
ncbi:eCIS core domain-containing protein [Saccharothrix algeriensis]|uniref:eCIS core domain-containing protein n=1 Tax=Saccharothrix algeriensis TaxID=173560 RepID=A0ABS2S5W2_9PSEU|nr:DUF4157 domain-containing protein [Saccharothrix algeriensis]MBM7810698.1 hypothetical protein [Saccharothrix algeriensis]